MKENETILFADDDSDVRQVACEILQMHGYRIIEAVDGQEAIDRFKENPSIDLIILDIVMPKKSGWEACKEIGGMDPHTKILITSGYADHIDVDDVKNDKVEFIIKPLAFDELLRRIREMLDR